MGITVYGRRIIRHLERVTGERIVHAAGPWLTTLDHYHLAWNGPPDATGYGLPEHWAPMAGCPPLASCGLLFGSNWAGRPRHFMTGGCRQCWAEPAQPHRHDCPVLLQLLTWPSINPDYWPVPVHRPRWMDQWKEAVRPDGS